MPPSQPHPPPPLPLPPPPLSLPSPSSSSTAAHRRRHHHHRRLASSSSSSSSSSAASIFVSPSPSPSRRSSRAADDAAGAGGDTKASVVVPFSWELHPGIPKNGHGSSSSSAAAAASEPLPLPPPLRASPPRRRHHRRRRSDGVPARSATGDDPFTAAFAECTREREDGATDSCRPAAPTRTVSAGRRSDASEHHRWWLSGSSGLVGFLDLYGCKSAMAVTDVAFLARRRPVVARTKQGSRATRRDK